MLPGAASISSVLGHSTVFTLTFLQIPTARPCVASCQTVNVLMPVSSAIPWLANSSWNSCWQKKYTLSLQRKLVYLASLLLHWLTPGHLFPELLVVEVIYWIDYPRSPGHQDRQCRMCLYVCLVFPTSGSSCLATNSEILDSIRLVIRKAALMCSWGNE